MINTPLQHSMLLKDILTTTKDGDWGKDVPKDGFLPYRVIRGADFPDVRHGDITTIPLCYLDATTVHRRTLEPLDILIETAGGNRDRPTGRTLLITDRLLSALDRPATCASFCRFLRVDRRLANPRYVFWYLQYLYSRGVMWNHQVQHTGVARFQYTKFAESTEIPLPKRPAQDRIADILSTFDDKIELNRGMNETLDGIVWQLFQHWFVDFDPVHAKAAVRHKYPKLTNAELSRRALPHIAPNIAEIFPAGFENSALGPIPKGWPIARLSDHTEASKGLSYKGSGLSAAGMPLHNLNSIYEGGGYKFEGIKFYTGDFKERHLVHPGEVIVANTEQGHDCLLLGYAAIVPDTFGKAGLFSHHIYRLRIRPTSQITADFLCKLLNSQRMHELVSGFGNGTTVNMLPIDGIEQPQFVVPPRELILLFTDLAASIRARQSSFISESRRLATTRDKLLPRLLSGEPSTGASLKGTYD